MLKLAAGLLLLAADQKGRGGCCRRCCGEDIGQGEVVAAAVCVMVAAGAPLYYATTPLQTAAALTYSTLSVWWVSCSDRR